MTDREKAIVMAYTGIVMLTGEKLNAFYEYLAELYGRPVYTHEIAALNIQSKCKSDFVELCQKEEPQRKKGKWVHGKELSKSYIGDMCIGINYEDWRCSVCNIAVETYDKPTWNFCPSCGAEMTGGDDEV